MCTTTTTTTTITADNYCLCESQIIFADYVKKIAAATGSGVGTFMHLRKGADPKDRTVMRINFDTLYSFAIIDLAEDATLVMPETNDRYQSAWMITEEHYNPIAMATPGTYTLTKESMGSRYLCICMRTQCDVTNPEDLAIAHALQDQLVLSQSAVGSYVPSHMWDMDEMLAMRAYYQELTVEKGFTSEMLFGKKGDVPLDEHNCGAAYGWGGLTADQAVYPMYVPTSDAPQTLTLKDVPVNAFWSITIYDQDGYPQGDVYNINSAAAETDKDGVATIHFGGDSNASNHMDVFEGWNFVLRMYAPTQDYFTGKWTRPELAGLAPAEQQ